MSRSRNLYHLLRHLRKVRLRREDRIPAGTVIVDPHLETSVTFIPKHYLYDCLGIGTVTIVLDAIMSFIPLTRAE